MRRSKPIWDRLSDLDLVQGALEHLQFFPDNNTDIQSAITLLFQLKDRIENAKSAQKSTEAAK